ncbi:hypothetical protein HYH03_014879 [Edaphochlamys debaryana]|uniref:MYND-type domain-containing protein n=1 Tax=Edaphochlamys debaryana TaxID=47281 RepID=A0A836BRT0_9CHLO|nr:hypothetical protein HYH03_014879 [Edaphochlamys debaryana]|eukprot:KAG2486432.1 hypothetical protein HYH03_014879 [Edaphochlamys debaryana]
MDVGGSGPPRSAAPSAPPAPASARTAAALDRFCAAVSEHLGPDTAAEAGAGAAGAAAAPRQRARALEVARGLLAALSKVDTALGGGEDEEEGEEDPESGEEGEAEGLEVESEEPEAGGDEAGDEEAGEEGRRLQAVAALRAALAHPRFAGALLRATAEALRWPGPAPEPPAAHDACTAGAGGSGGGHGPHGAQHGQQGSSPEAQRARAEESNTARAQAEWQVMCLRLYSRLLPPAPEDLQTGPDPGLLGPRLDLGRRLLRSQALQALAARLAELGSLARRQDGKLAEPVRCLCCSRHACYNAAGIARVMASLLKAAAELVWACVETAAVATEVAAEEEEEAAASAAVAATTVPAAPPAGRSPAAPVSPQAPNPQAPTAKALPTAAGPQSATPQKAASAAAAATAAAAAAAACFTQDLAAALRASGVVEHCARGLAEVAQLWDRRCVLMQALAEACGADDPWDLELDPAAAAAARHGVVTAASFVGWLLDRATDVSTGRATGPAEARLAALGALRLGPCARFVAVARGVAVLCDVDGGGVHGLPRALAAPAILAVQQAVAGPAAAAEAPLETLLKLIEEAGQGWPGADAPSAPSSSSSSSAAAAAATGSAAASTLNAATAAGAGASAAAAAISPSPAASICSAGGPSRQADAAQAVRDCMRRVLSKLPDRRCGRLLAMRLARVAARALLPPPPAPAAAGAGQAVPLLRRGFAQVAALAALHAARPLSGPAAEGAAGSGSGGGAARPSARDRAQAVEWWRLLGAALPHTPATAVDVAAKLLVQALPVLPPSRLAPAPSPDVVAALAGGALPTLERLIRNGVVRLYGIDGAVLRDVLAEIRCYALPQLGSLLAYGDLRQVGALVATVAKALRFAQLRWAQDPRLLAAIASGGGGGGGGVAADDPFPDSLIRVVVSLLCHGAASLTRFGEARIGRAQLTAPERQLADVLAAAAAAWLPPLQRLGERGTAEASWIAALTAARWIPLAAAAATPAAPAPAAAAAAAAAATASAVPAGQAADGGWRRWLLGDLAAVPRLGVMLARLEPDAVGQGPMGEETVVRACVALAAACPAEVAGGGEGGGGGAAQGPAWCAAALHPIATRLRRDGGEEEAAGAEALRGLLLRWSGRAGGCGGGGRAGHGRSRAGGGGAGAGGTSAAAQAAAALAAQLAAWGPPAQAAAALLPPSPSAALQLLGGCANPACANLEGDSEAGLRLQRCGRCGAASYCCRECRRRTGGRGTERSAAGEAEGWDGLAAPQEKGLAGRRGSVPVAGP